MRRLSGSPIAGIVQDALSGLHDLFLSESGITVPVALSLEPGCQGAIGAVP